ncbi:transferase hexapeptide repeat containing protein [Haloterrigena turkmenica DSM 5511]|uniref:Transferase hexapeptide repeat containing protein n=1 Tax=Haloterrigena turkmenica (strain ATCC 51198 / DSM 5511 / JCM 9101 / NCIMB 13204 / VKM B-1734 / 4k) TaxID=543526 RepID=D2RUH2_HALTV|nr:acyltransferase [Haloterrigena turkmenica]ADB61144.1 transferase hexapeptide repeat containing protein [Haloterrigena turkmenica DSM 5511]
MTDETDSRHDRIRHHPTAGPGNSLADWTRARHPLRVAVSYVAVWLIRISPSLRLKRWLLRRLGATVGPGVSWGLEATPDVFWPELITVEREAIVGYDATILCHEFLQDEYRTGEVVIGERAMIGAGAIVLPGVEIGANARVAANSLVTRDVPPGTTVAGVPAEPVGSSAASDASAEAAADSDPGADDSEPGDDATGSGNVDAGSADGTDA